MTVAELIAELQEYVQQDERTKDFEVRVAYPWSAGGDEGEPPDRTLEYGIAQPTYLDAGERPFAFIVVGKQAR